MQMVQLLLSIAGNMNSAPEDRVAALSTTRNIALNSPHLVQTPEISRLYLDISLHYLKHRSSISALRTARCIGIRWSKTTNSASWGMNFRTSPARVRAGTPEPTS